MFEPQFRELNNKLRRSCATSILLFAIGQASASVVCEYELAPAGDDCTRCFKTDAAGSYIVLNGQIPLDSFRPITASTVNHGKMLYQRGMQRRQIPGSNFKSFELCYISAPIPQVVGGVIRLKPGEVGEFQLRVANQQPNLSYRFVLKGKPANGMATLFDNTLAFMPPRDWNGAAEVQYEAVTQNGVRSNLGVIRFEVGHITKPITPPRPTEEDVARLEQQQRDIEERVELEKAIRDAEAQLAAESSDLGKTKADFAALDFAISAAKGRLSEVNEAIAMTMDALAANERLASDQEARDTLKLDVYDFPLPSRSQIYLPNKITGQSVTGEVSPAPLSFVDQRPNAALPGASLNGRRREKRRRRARRRMIAPAIGLYVVVQLGVLTARRTSIQGWVPAGKGRRVSWPPVLGLYVVLAAFCWKSNSRLRDKSASREISA